MTVVWTPTAVNSYLELVEYFSEFWGEKQHINFKNRTIEALEKIKKNPGLYKKYAGEVRQAILLEKISLFFRVREERIELIAFWHNSRNPDRLKVATS